MDYNERAGRSIVKSYSLDPEDLEILELIQNRLGSRSTGSDAIRYLINWWRLNDPEADK